MAKECPLVSSEVRRGKRTTSIWHLKNWNNDATFWQHIAHSKCSVDVDLEEGVPEARFRFYLQESKPPTKLSESLNLSRLFRNRKSGPSHRHLGLHVDYSFNKEQEQNRIIKCDFQVTQVQPVQPVNQIFIRTINGRFIDVPDKVIEVAESETTARILLEKEFILARIESGDSSFKPPPEVWLKISVTPTYIHYGAGQVAKFKEYDESPPANPERNVATVEKRSTHLKLETKDGVILEADKFMLAAKSPFLKVLIENESKKLEFDGRVKLPHVDGKPMRCLLHWMQSGELHEDVVRCMDQLVEAAITFECNELVKILEKKMIDMCSPENMYQLLSCAEKYGLTQAIADIAKFIEEQKHMQIYS